MKILFTAILKLIAIVVCLFLMPLGCSVVVHNMGERNDWQRFHRHGSTQQAPDPQTSDAVIQVYAARAARWRGAFGVHTWIATKRTHETRYQRLEVIGYRLRWTGETVQVRLGTPDAMWFGNNPTLLREIRGDENVDLLIEKLHQAAADYPYNDRYSVWPGPNSNTFIAYLARQVPQLRLELPSTAIGKDYLPNGKLAAGTPSGLGVQVSAGGYLGMLAGIEEGVEVNFLGLTAGIDLLPPAIKLPGIGRVGFSDTRRVRID